MDQRIGLDSDWWRFPDREDRIATLLRAAFASEWASNIQTAFALNRGSLRPENWTQLAKAILKHRDDLRRLKKSGIAEPMVRYRVAIKLGVPEHDLAPSADSLISAATRLLFKDYAPDFLESPRIAIEAGVYGSFILLAGRREFLEADQVFVHLAKQFPQLNGCNDARESVLRTSQSVGSILRVYFAEYLNDIAKGYQIDERTAKTDRR